MRLSQQLKEAHSEELSDAEKYLKMSESAPEKYAPILRDIAHEEEVHAKHIKAILDDMPSCNCDENSEETVSESPSSDQIDKESDTTPNGSSTKNMIEPI